MQIPTINTYRTGSILLRHTVDDRSVLDINMFILARSFTSLGDSTCYLMVREEEEASTVLLVLFTRA